MYFAFFSFPFLCAFSFLIHFLQWKTIFSPGVSPYLLWGVAACFSIPLIHYPPLPVFHTSEEIQRHCSSSAGWECHQGTGLRAVVHQEVRASLQLCSLIPKHFSARLAEPWAPGDCTTCWGHPPSLSAGFPSGLSALENALLECQQKVLIWEP